MTRVRRDGVRSVRRAVLRLLLVAALAVGGAAVSASPAQACSCAGLTDREAYDSADVVFVGEALERREPSDPQTTADAATYVFRVSAVHKGVAHRTQAVATAASGASCGLEIPATGTFLVFANTGDRYLTIEGERLGPGDLVANLCGGTRSISDAPVGSGPVPAATTAPRDGESAGVGADDPPPIEREAGDAPPLSGLWVSPLAWLVAPLAVAIVAAGWWLRWRRELSEGRRTVSS